MPTQNDVITAFAEFEDSPQRASNMRVVEADSRDFLCGGRNGAEFVIAIRQPLRQLIYWRRAPLHTRMQGASSRRQVRRARHVFRGYRDDESMAVEMSGNRAPDVGIYPDLMEEHPRLTAQEQQQAVPA